MAKPTIDQIMSLNPCDDYSRETIEALLDQPLDTAEQWTEALLTLPRRDARWFLARILPVNDRVAWAKNCAERAKDHAECAEYAAKRAERAAYWAERAAYWAEWAAEWASKGAAEEHRKAVEHGVALMLGGGVVMPDDRQHVQWGSMLFAVALCAWLIVSQSW